MRRLLIPLLNLAAAAALVIGAWMFSPVAGCTVLGLALMGIAGGLQREKSVREYEAARGRDRAQALVRANTARAAPALHPPVVPSGPMTIDVGGRHDA
ncbi:MAG TPA: hypothetical protein VK399_02895 [Longimicrobiaceae bacterium]|nr:hypothetical protein [Longimicrobiaceae bacterium]